MGSIESNKHAYMIIAHNNWGQLKKLLMLIDDKRNDIYIHIDKKSKLSPNELQDISSVVKKSKLIWTKRVKVQWGGYSQIISELVLLKEAVKSPHSYYHLISGVDLPIKTKDEIYSFFESQPKREYINFQLNIPEKFWIDQRIREYHFFQDIIGRNEKGIIGKIKKLEDTLLEKQRKMKVDRVKGKIRIHKGANWFSITHEMAVYVLSREKEIKKLFNYGLTVDELFLQTIAMDSPYKDRIDHDYKREIDWMRGFPYTWKINDLDELMNSKALWARKFDEKVDNDIIEAIFTRLK